MTDFSWRPIEPGDVGAWAALLTAVADADGDPDRHGERELLELFEFPGCDFTDGSIAAFDGSVMVAGAFLLARSTADPAQQVRFAGDVHPAYRRRGLGGQVLDWVESAAVALHQKRQPGQPLTVRGSSKSGNAADDALFSARGYRPVRWWHTMRMDLSAITSAVPAPDGVQVTGYTPEASEDARQVRNEAFLDHWGSTESTVESWAHIVTGESFRPEFSYLAYADGEPLGVLLSYEHDAYTEATGVRDLYIGLVSTRRAGRNRGIASALLTGALIKGKAAGFGTSSLFVDGDSLTGAVGLYERIGYVVEHTTITQTKELIPADDGDASP
jgi:mycothiol synthase